MADLCDLDHFYGEDIPITATGDIATATKETRTIQRIIRRLLTAPTGNGSAYPWQPNYGAGLGAKIGEDLDVRAIAAIVRSQVMMEPTVKKIPAPVIEVTLIDLGASINITYTDISGVPQTFSFNLVN